MEKREEGDSGVWDAERIQRTLAKRNNEITKTAIPAEKVQETKKNHTRRDGRDPFEGPGTW